MNLEVVWNTLMVEILWSKW